jgi:hypothetical protein
VDQKLDSLSGTLGDMKRKQEGQTSKDSEDGDSWLALTVKISLLLGLLLLVFVLVASCEYRWQTLM